MNFDKYPRPMNDNTIGVHGPSSTDRFENSEYSWSRIRTYLEEMDIRWFLFLTAGDSNLPLAKRLVDMGLMPICRFYFNEQYPDYNIDPTAIKKFVDVGVPYFVFGNEPDSFGREWSSPPPDDWLEIVVGTFIRDARICIGEGGIPIFPAFSFGSDPDRPNLAQMIVDMAGSFAPELIKKMCWSVHNYGLGRPIRYPNDLVTKIGKQITQTEYDSYGKPWVDWRFSWEVSREEVNRQRAAMPEVRDGTDDILKNPTCFRNYEYFDHLIRQAFGESVPIFGTEFGWHFHSGIQGDNRWPFLTPQEASQITMDAFRYTQIEGPDYYFANFYWLLGHDVFGLGQSDYEFQGPLLTTQFQGFGIENNEYPLVQLLKQEKPRNIIRANGPLPEQWPYYPHPWRDGFDRNIRYTNPPMVLQSVDEPSVHHWKLTEVAWEKEGKGRAYIRCKINDEFQEGQDILSDWGDGNAKAKTKGAVDGYYGNVAVPAISSLSVMGVAVDSDKLTNVYEGEVYCTFELVEGGSEPVFDHIEYRKKFLAADVTPMPDEVYAIEVTPGIQDENQDYYKIIGVHHLWGHENEMQHNLFVDVVDEIGLRLHGALVEWTWEGRQDDEEVFPVRIGNKAPNEVADIALGANQIMSAWVGQNSDRVSNVTTGLNFNGPTQPVDGNAYGHHSFYVLWQRTSLKPEPPTPDPQPDPSPPPVPQPSPDGAIPMLLHAQNVLSELKEEIDNFLAQDVALVDIAEAIGEYESNGDYSAENPNSTASGKYQYLDSTWANYGGFARAKDAPPRIQDKRVLEDLQDRKTRYGGNIEKMIAHHYYPVFVGDESVWDDPVPVEGGISLRQYVNGVLAKL